MRREILSKLSYLRRYVLLLKKLQRHPKGELERNAIFRGAAERYLQLSLEIVLEMAEMIIAKEGYKKPESHREAILLLGKHRIIPRRFAEKLAPAAGLRNILVHGYAEVDIGKLYLHLQKDIKDFDIFAKHIAKYLRKKNA